MIISCIVISKTLINDASPKWVILFFNFLLDLFFLKRFLETEDLVLRIIYLKTLSNYALRLT